MKDIAREWILNAGAYDANLHDESDIDDLAESLAELLQEVHDDAKDER